MKHLRLTRLQVGIAGFVVLVGVFLLFALAFIRPLMAEIGKTEGDAETQEAYVKTNGPKAVKDLEEANHQKKIVKAQFDKIMEARMPKIDLSDPIAGMFRLWTFPREEGQLMDKWFRSSGAQVSGYSFPGFTSNLADPNVKVLGPYQWNLTVQTRDFPELLKWLEKLPKAPRFMVMQSVTIGGARQPGQPLTASVPVTLYEWTKAAEVALETARVAGAAAGGTAPGGAAPGGAGAGGAGGRGGGMGGRGGGMGGRGGGMRGGGGGMRGGGGGMRGG